MWRQIYSEKSDRLQSWLVSEGVSSLASSLLAAVLRHLHIVAFHRRPPRTGRDNGAIQQRGLA